MNVLRSKAFRRVVMAGAGLYGGQALLSGRQSADDQVSMASLEPIRLTGGSRAAINYQAIADKRSKLVYKSREQHLREAQQNPEYDVIIVGGGCTGAGVALNTAAAGLRTLLVEAYDFGTATSSKSTKLLHGGYRYFQQIFEFNLKFNLKRENYGLVIESVQERDVVINNAPHVNRYVGLCVPCRNLIMAAYYYVGLFMYHYLSMQYKAETSEFSCPGPKIIGVDELRAHFPLLDSKFNWGVVVYDGEMDDARLLTETLLTAAQDKYRPNMKGANIVNYAKMTGFLKDAQGKITGIEFVDKISQQTYRANAACVVNATGNFSDNIRRMDDPAAKKRIVHSLGTHIMLDGSFCSRSMGILIPKTSDGRVLFVVPWLHSTTVGTTDFVQKQAVVHPTPTPACLEFLGKEISELYPALKDKDPSEYVKAKWSGLRPLVMQHEEEDDDQLNSKGSGKNISRTHLILESNSGLISVMGGKWTIYRKMGEDTLLRILRRKQPDLSEVPVELSTKNLRYIGDYREGVVGLKLAKNAQPSDHAEYTTGLVRDLHLRHSALGLPLLNHLARAYGLRALDILEMIGTNPELSERIHPKFEITKAEVLYQIRNELVVNVFDLLLRRNRIAFEDKEAASSVMPLLIDILGTEKGWDVAAKRANLRDARELFVKMDF